jgi:hypothetical protein
MTQAPPAASRAAPSLDRDEHDLLVFAIQWLPYGGGPVDEIFIQFGMTPQRFRERLQDIIIRHQSRIHPTTWARLVEVWLPQLSGAAQQTEERRRHADHGAA